MTDNFIKPFVSNKFPDFVESGHPQFKLFVEAYYEWLEKQNTGSAATVLELFKELPNPGGIINNLSQNGKDIDETLDGFVDYFRSELIPFATSASTVDSRFLVKKIRDVYLSKGTPKSFKLLFRLLYNKEIDIFETKENIIDSSEGKYFSFPIGYFVVSDFNDRVFDVDFAFSYVSNTGSDVIGTILSGNVIGKSKDNQEIINFQFADEYSLDIGKEYFVVDGSDPTKFFKVRPVYTLNNASITRAGSFYKENDQILLTSKYFQKDFFTTITNIERGPVTELVVKNLGQGYSVGDSFTFVSDNIFDGSGGGFRVTGVDSGGRIVEIDGTDCRTGILNNGFLAGTFQPVTIPIANGGQWRAPPSIRYNPGSTNNEGAPYFTGGKGHSFEAEAVSDQIGKVADVIFDQIPYFYNDSDDVVLNFPMNVVVSNPANIKVGNTVTFQKFEDNNDSFRDDSEQLIYRIRVYRDLEGSNLEKYFESSFPVVYGFDSDLFQFSSFTWNVKSDVGVWEADSDWRQLANKLNYFRHINEDLIFDGEEFDALDSDGNVLYDSDLFHSGGTVGKDIDGGNSFASTGNVLDLGPGFDDIASQYVTIVLEENEIIDQLDDYHFASVAATNRDDSELYSFAVRNKLNPNLGVVGNMGKWKSVGNFGRVIKIEGNVVKIVPVDGMQYPTKDVLDHISKDKYSLLRLSALDASGREDSTDTLQLTNVVNYVSDASVDLTFSAITTTPKKFLNEDGFVSSVKGGVIQDGKFFGDHTYLIKSDLTISEWREVIKKTLHPAGKYMFAETSVNQSFDYKVESNVTSDTGFKQLSAIMRFDANQEHYEDPSEYYAVTADNSYFKSNSFLDLYGPAANGTGIKADSYMTYKHVVNSAQNGNAFWDYEPIGLIQKQNVDVTAFSTLENFVQADVEKRYLTTQDSDGNGYVATGTKYHHNFDNTSQDFYKNDSRRGEEFTPTMIVKTGFADTFADGFSVYNNPISNDWFMRFGDSDTDMVVIDYDEQFALNPSKFYSVTRIKRFRDYLEDNEVDFLLAMRETGSLTFIHNELEYSDLEAHEWKWNRINSKRTINTDGWMIPGYPSALQNTSSENKRKRRQTPYDDFTPLYTITKTPLTPDAWNDSNSPDFWIWNKSYLLELNNVADITNLENTVQDEQWDVFDRDPQKLMRHRRG